MVLSEDEKVSSTRWLGLGFVGFFYLVLLAGFLFFGVSSFFSGENVFSLFFFAVFVLLSLGFAGLCKKFWSDFVNSFLNFLVNIFFPAVSQDGMFMIAVLALLIFSFSALSLKSLVDFDGLMFDEYF
ncbi:MAG: hypothetical protein GON13_02645 [Nanoarchaeota archaeon]|nr:hypothetical protein [Nanoarchaeota archaeon]